MMKLTLTLLEYNTIFGKTGPSAYVYIYILKAIVWGFYFKNSLIIQYEFLILEFKIWYHNNRDTFKSAS